MPPHPLRASAVRHAGELLAELVSGEPPPGPVRAAVSDGEWVVRVEVVPAGVQAGAADRPGSLPAGLTPLERQILAAATAQPQTAKRLAGRCGRPCNSHFRGGLRALCRREPPLLVHTPDGYRLPA